MDHQLKKFLEDTLLKLPSKDFTARTMQKIHEVQESRPAKRKSSRWLILPPLAATALLALLLAIFMPWGSLGTISWADVRKQFEQVQTVTFRSYYELENSSWKRSWSATKIYLKDPGLRRIEIYDTEDDLSTVNPEPQWIAILKSEPGLSRGLTLHPDSRWAEMWTEVFNAYGQEPSSTLLKRLLPQENLNFAKEQWDRIKKITEDKTQPIGSQVINGRTAVGFSFAVPVQKEKWGEWAPDEIPGKIWVGRDDGVPLLIELEGETGLGDNKIRWVITDIQWNAPIDEGLFDLTVPTGWGLSRHLENSIEYENIGLSPYITLEIGPEGQETLACAGDVAGLVRTERTNRPDHDPGCTGLITIELAPGAAKRLHDYADAHPDKPILVNFDGLITVAAKLDAIHPAQLSFDISQLGLPMFEVEEKYSNIAIIEKTIHDLSLQQLIRKPRRTP